MDKFPHKPELLLPAGTLERLKVAFLYGADAVYAGMPAVSLRNKTSFTPDEMKQGIDYAHNLGKKVYLTMNLFSHDRDLPAINAFIKELAILQPDGVIVSDAGIFNLLREKLPQLPRHISTQANVCSSLTVGFWEKQGAALCVLGREVPLNEIREIRKKCPTIRLEMFIHGALCISYSGRCLLSSFTTGRNANQGNCAHTCRWRYKTYQGGITPPDKQADYYLEEETRPQALFQIDEDSHGTYILNSRDLCLLPRLPDILPIGMDSFKIEGRNKSEYYVAVTAHAYRHAIDDWFNNPSTWQPDAYMAEIMTLHARGYTYGFLDGTPGAEAQNYNEPGSQGTFRYAAIVREIRANRIVAEVKHKIEKNMLLEAVIPQSLTPLKIQVHGLYDPESHAPIDSISAGRVGQLVEIDIGINILDLISSLTVLRIRPTGTTE